MNHSATNFGIPAEVVIFMTCGHQRLRDMENMVNCMHVGWSSPNCLVYSASPWDIKGSFTSDFCENRNTCLLYMLSTFQFPSCFKFGYA